MTQYFADPPDRWFVWLWRAVLALGLGVVLVLTVYTSLRIRQVYELSHQVEQLKADLTQEIAEGAARGRANAERIDQLERAVFGDILAKLEKEKAARLAATADEWQKNRDADIRDRLARLEQWRFRHEQSGK